MVQYVQVTNNHWVKKVERVQLEEHPILYNNKDLNEICTRTEEVLDVKWTGGEGGGPQTLTLECGEY